jgi:hypothetical protein
MREQMFALNELANEAEIHGDRLIPFDYVECRV